MKKIVLAGMPALASAPLSVQRIPGHAFSFVYNVRIAEQPGCVAPPVHHLNSLYLSTKQ